MKQGVIIDNPRGILMWTMFPGFSMGSHPTIDQWWPGRMVQGAKWFENRSIE
jgi:hypothetical protein